MSLENNIYGGKIMENAVKLGDVKLVEVSDKNYLACAEIDETLYDFVKSCGCEIEFASRKAEELEKYIELEAKKLSEPMAEELLQAKKEDLQLEVLKKVQEDGIHREGMRISTSSPLISETVIIDGQELHPTDFVPDSVYTDHLYEGNQLIKNSYSLEWQEVNRITGKRKFVSNFSPTSVLIANPKSLGKCEAIIVTLKGERTPLVFSNGDIDYEQFRKQTRFARKGLNAGAKVFYESFLRAIRECPCKLFLTIPKHAGWINLQVKEVV